MKTKIVFLLSVLLLRRAFADAQAYTNYFGNFIWVYPDLITNCQVVDPSDGSP